MDKAKRGAWNGMAQSICEDCGFICGDCGRNTSCEECDGPMVDATVQDLLDAQYSADEVTESKDV